MKRKTTLGPDEELRPRYGRELFRAMTSNRFAGAEPKFKGSRAVYLDADVAEVFDTSEAVNTFLRSVIRAMRRGAPRASRTARTKRGGS